jgi:ABC-type amino acid transport substrate-binding protein
MRVGVVSTQDSPYVIRDGNKYSGIAIDIWEQVAKKADIEFSYVEAGTSHEMAIEMLKNREVDILVGPYTISDKRYRDNDYTIPFYYSNIALASSKKTNNLENYINISKVFGSIIFLFICILFINNFINNFNTDVDFADFFINSIPTFKNRKMYFLYTIILLSVIVIYINTYQPNISLTPSTSVYGANVIYSNTHHQIIKKILKKFKFKGTLVENKATSDKQKQIQDNTLFNFYINNKDSQYGFIDDSSKIAYILNNNIEKYSDIRIIRNKLASFLYAFIVPKGSDYLDKINTAIREAQSEKISQIIVTKYLGPKYENNVSF